jgi:hypothetical protein
MPTARARWYPLDPEVHTLTRLPVEKLRELIDAGELEAVVISWPDLVFVTPAQLQRFVRSHTPWGDRPRRRGNRNWKPGTPRAELNNVEGAGQA